MGIYNLGISPKFPKWDLGIMKMHYWKTEMTISVNFVINIYKMTCANVSISSIPGIAAAVVASLCVTARGIFAAVVRFCCTLVDI